ncbi:MAG: hypothetical protein JNN01_11650, partial [Opitutaceae bacterium]|nr:hypothetical protein [Opitutaceae bacterium]
MGASVIVHDCSTGLSSARAQRVLLGLHRALEFRELWTALQRVFETLVPHDTLVMSV